MRIGAMFTSADVELVVHATESLERVMDALDGTLGIGGSMLRREVLTGHHGNEIVLLKGSITGDDAKHLADRVIGALSSEDISEICRDIYLYTDDRRSLLYIRISKQEMVNGRIRLSQSDAVRIRLRLARHGASIEAVRSALAGADG
ncbi:MAG: RNA-binding domain-containing protein [Candidatus Nitrosocaldus sp.]|nr:hypothetical protein [Candidatus Nitrosocaldus sp.]MDW8275741.1 RNA-binding domain-containing protein [Candidatus Nitrosocaldus sp.]